MASSHSKAAVALVDLVALSLTPSSDADDAAFTDLAAGALGQQLLQGEPQEAVVALSAGAGVAITALLGRLVEEGIFQDATEALSWLRGEMVQLPQGGRAGDFGSVFSSPSKRPSGRKLEQPRFPDFRVPARIRRSHVTVTRMRPAGVR
jgi:hypothetical protein